MQPNYQSYLRRKRFKKWLGIGLGIGLVFAGRLAASSQPNSAVSTESQAVAPAVSQPAIDWRSIIEEIDDCRADALQARAIERLIDCEVPDSSSYQADEKTIRYLISKELELAGFRLKILQVEFVARGMQADMEVVQLQVVDELPKYEIRSQASVVNMHAGRGAKTWQVWIQKSGNRWRLSDVKPA